MTNREAAARMKPKPEYDVTKLPKWAQDELRRKDRQIKELQELLAERDGAIGSTQTYVREWGSTAGRKPGDEMRPLPRDATVQFRLDESPAGMRHDYVDVKVEEVALGSGKGPRRPWLRLMAGSTLEISLQSSNVCYVRVMD